MSPTAPARRGALKDRIQTGRMGQTRGIADGLHVLASEASSLPTGSEVVVDGSFAA